MSDDWEDIATGPSPLLSTSISEGWEDIAIGPSTTNHSEARAIGNSALSGIGNFLSFVDEFNPINATESTNQNSIVLKKPHLFGLFQQEEQPFQSVFSDVGKNLGLITEDKPQTETGKLLSNIAEQTTSALPFGLVGGLSSGLVGGLGAYGGEKAATALGKDPETGKAIGSILASLIPSAVSSFANQVGKEGDKLYLGALGATANDIKKSRYNLADTIKAVKDEGAFSEGFDPLTVINKINQGNATRGEQVGKIIAEADQSGATALPEFNSTLDYIDRLKGTAKKDAFKYYQDEVSGLIDTLDNGGNLADWQAAKQSLQGQLSASYSKQNPSLKTEIQQLVASDVRQHIEDQTASLIPDRAGEIGALNLEIGARKQLLPILERAANREEATDPIRRWIASTRTSGGFGVPILAATATAASGGSTALTTLAATLASAALMDPANRMRLGSAANLFKNISPGLEKLGINTLPKGLIGTNISNILGDLSNDKNSSAPSDNSIFSPGSLKKKDESVTLQTGDMKPGQNFEDEVKKIASDLEVDPTHLMAAMNFETGGTLDSAEKNKAGSGAVGLIQFMPSTAKELLGAPTKDMATELMASMTPEEQLQYVKKYLSPYKGKLKSLDDVYMAILYPKAIGKDSDYPLFKAGTTAYKQNSGLDNDKDGVVTKSEAASKVKDYIA